MSSSLSNHLSPALLPLPLLPTWQQAGSSLKQRARLYGQDMYKLWDNALQFRREDSVEQIDQATAAPQALALLAQSRTGLLAHEAVIVKQRARQAVTALRTVDDGLHLVSWRINADGSLLRTGSNTLPLAGIQQVQMVHARNYVVACRTNHGDVHLSRWDVSNTGAIYLAGSQRDCAQHSQWWEMAVLTPDLIVTLSLTATQTWQVSLWQLQGQHDLQLLQSHEIPAAAVNSCGLAVLPALDGTLRWATLLSATPTTLALHLWHYTPETGCTVAAQHRIATAPMAAVLLAHVDQHYLQIVVQSVTGQLHLFTGQVTAGEQVMMAEDGKLLGDAIRHCACQPHPAGFTLVNQTQTGELQLQRWQQQPDGSVQLLDTGHTAATQVMTVACCDEALEGNAPLLTGMIEGNGEVILTTWR